MHRRCYVQCVVHSFFKIISNSLTSAQNSCIITVNLNVSCTILKSSIMLLVKMWERGQPKTVIHSKSSPLSSESTQGRFFTVTGVSFLDTLEFALVRFFCQRLALTRPSACRPSRCCMRRLRTWSKRPMPSVSVLPYADAQYWGRYGRYIVKGYPDVSH